MSLQFELTVNAVFLSLHGPGFLLLSRQQKHSGFGNRTALKQIQGLNKADFAHTSSYCQEARERFKTHFEEITEEVNKTGMCEVRFICYFL